jgi:tRNA-dihydrouridine synthase
MAELSHRALRELIVEFDRDPIFLTEESGTPPPTEYVTEMLSAAAFLGGGPFEKWYLDAGPCPAQVVYQLVGADPAQLEKAAALLDGRDCLGIDINMGCAAPAIRRTGAGVAWTGAPDRAGALIGRLRSVVKRKRLSVKLRCPVAEPAGGRGGKRAGDRSGGDGEPPAGGAGRGDAPGPGPSGDRSGGERIFERLLRFCRVLEAEGVELITLHPRLAGEKFKRPARWDYVERLRAELGIPVAGNGDIGGAAELLHRAAGGRAMVGRGAVRRPWIFAEARLLAAGEHRGAGQSAGRAAGQVINLETTGLRFLELLSRYQPPEFHLSRARRFFSYFCDTLKWGTYVKNLLNREETLGGIEGAWRGYFAAHPEEAGPVIPGNGCPPGSGVEPN